MNQKINSESTAIDIGNISISQTLTPAALEQADNFQNANLV